MAGIEKVCEFSGEYPGSDMDQVKVGVLPNGLFVYATHALITQEGIAKTRYNLVDRHWFDAGLIPPGYCPVRTSLSSHPMNTAWVKADAIYARFAEIERDVK